MILPSRIINTLLLIKQSRSPSFSKTTSPWIGPSVPTSTCDPRSAKVQREHSPRHRKSLRPGSDCQLHTLSLLRYVEEQRPAASERSFVNRELLKSLGWDRKQILYEKYD